ncbi:hypothetical protein EDB83DRAFT_2512704 [Lactarius deliciosus]|nr:hypothetical protein EDB83DRAFT_2512704 [Lactarius deliciosus]
MFSPGLRRIVRRIARTPPPVEQVWYLPWAMILANIFPEDQGYGVAAQHHVPRGGGNYFLDFGVVLIPQEDSDESQDSSQNNSDSSQNNSDSSQDSSQNDSQDGSQNDSQDGSQNDSQDGSQDGLPYGIRTVLNMEIKKDSHWPAGIPSLEERTNLVAAAFRRNATEELCWIEAIGPKWRYGIKRDDGMPPTPLSDWDDISDDTASLRPPISL